MTELSENTTVEIPLRNLVALSAGIVMATTAYVTLDTRITGVEHGHEIQNAKIMALEEKIKEMNDIEKDMRAMEIELGRLRSHTETQEQKIETLFELWNSKVAKN
jgi:hypothetical protein